MKPRVRPFARRRLHALLALAIGGLPVSSAFAVDYNFVPETGSADWNDGANWTTLPADDGNFPNAPGDFANLVKDFTGNMTVNVTGDVSVGRIDLGDNNGTQTLTLAGTGGTRVVTFDATSGNAKLNVATAGTGDITLNNTVRFVLADNLDLTRGTHILNLNAQVDLGANTLTILGNGGSSLNIGTSTATANLLTGAGSVVVSHTGGGFASFGGQNTFSGGVVINSGNTAALTNSVGANGTLVSGAFGTGTVTINGGLIRATSSGNRTVGNQMVFGGNFTIGDSGTATGLTIAGDVTLTGNRTISVAGGSGAAELAGRHTIAGVIRDGGNGFGFTKNGSGTFLLTGVNTYSGTTAVIQGNLVVGGDAPSGAPGTLGNSTTAISLGGTGSGSSNTLGLLAGIAGPNPGSATITIGRNITVGNANNTGSTTIGTTTDTNAVFSGDIALSRTVLLTSASATPDRAARFTGVISGSGGLVKVSGGAVQVTGTNTYTGTTTVRAGTLLVGGNVAPSTAGPLGNAASAVAVGDATSAAADSPTLALDGAFTFSRDINVAASAAGIARISATNAAATIAEYSGNVILGRNAVLANATAGATTRFTGNITDGAGSFGVTINGPGTVEFASALPHSYNGLTTVASGTLLLNSSAIGGVILGDSNTTTADVLISGGTLLFGANDQLAQDVTIQMTGGALDLAGRSQTIFDLDYTGGALLNAGGLTITSSADLFLFDGTSVAAPTVLNRRLIFAGATTAGSVSGGLALDADPSHEFAINDSAAAVDVNVSGVISNQATASTITKRGNGVLRLSAPGGNTFGGAGQTVTIEGGVLSISQDNQLGDAANTVTFTGGALRFESNLSTARALNVTANGGGIDAPAGVTVTIANAGQISGNGILGKLGAGILEITGDQSGSWTGGSALLSAGTLRVSAENQLGAAGNDITFQGGTLEVTQSFSTDATKVITLGTGGGTLKVSADQALTVGNAGGITGNTVLTKMGAGRLILAAANAGFAAGAGVNIIEGVIELQNAQSLGNAPKVPVTLSGGTLALRNDAATTFGNPVTVAAGDSTIVSDVLTTGNAGVTQTLGALSLGAGRLTAETGANVTAGAPIVAFSSTTLTGNGTLAAAAGGRMNTGGMTLGTNKLTIDGAGTVNLNGAISGGPGAGQVAIEKNGPGIALSSTTASTFTGDVVINDGTYELSGATALGNAANVIKLNGGMLLSSAGANGYALEFRGGTVGSTGGNRDFNGVTSATPSITFVEDTVFSLDDPKTPGTLRDINFGAAAGNTGVPTSVGPVNITVNASSANTASNRLRFRQTAVAGSMTGTITVNQFAIAQFRGAGEINGAGSGMEVRLNGGRFEFAADVDTTFGNNVVVVSDSALGVGRVTTGNDNRTFTAGSLFIGSNVLTTVDVSSAPVSNDRLAFTGGTVLTGNATFSTGADLILNTVAESGGSFGFTKLGTRTLTLNGPSNYTGTTTVSAGTLILGAAGALGEGGLHVTGGTLNMNGHSDAVNAFTMTGGTITGGGGTLATPGVMADGGTINTILAGTGGVTKNGAGTLTLGAVNVFAGDVVMNSGTFNLGVDEALPDLANVTVNGGVFNFAGGNNTARSETIANLTVNGGQVRTSIGMAATPSLVTITGTLDVASGDFAVNSTANVSANKVIFGGHVQGLHVIGGNTPLQVNELIVGAGGLEFTGAQLRMNLGVGSALGSRVVLNGDVTSFPSFNEAGFFGQSNGDTIGAREIAIGSGNRTFTVADGDAFNDLRAEFALVGTGGITKEGPGRFWMQGANTYAGPTNVNNGTLVVTGSITGSVTVNTGATLVLDAGGSTGAVTLQGGTLQGNGGLAGSVNALSGVVAPGNSAGFLSTGNFLLGPDADLQMEIGGLFGANQDQLNVVGTVTLGGDLVGSLIDGFVPIENDIFYLILNDDIDPIAGGFAGLGEGALLSFGGFDWTITYMANGDFGFESNDVALIAVPEPGSALLLLGGLGALAGLRRRRATTR